MIRIMAEISDPNTRYCKTKRPLAKKFYTEFEEDSVQRLANEIEMLCYEEDWVNFTIDKSRKKLNVLASKKREMGEWRLFKVNQRVLGGNSISESVIFFLITI
jgi:hypothetical protein